MERVSPALAVALVLGLLGAPPAGAQGVAAGARVRIDAPDTGDGLIVGTLRGASSESLRVQAEGRDWAVEVPRRSVRGLWVSDGKGSKAVLGALLGGLAGAAAGYFIAGEDEDPTTGDGRGLSVVFGAAGGAVLGGLVGNAIKHERWRSVDIAAVRSTRMPPPPVRLTLRF
jgi:hypothetical protein